MEIGKKRHIKPCICATCQKARQDKYQEGFEAGLRACKKQAQKIIREME